MATAQVPVATGINYYSDELNPRGIPAAKFIDNVEVFVGPHDLDQVRTELQEQLQKYKYMEASKRQSRRTYITKLPEIKKALDVVNLLIEKRDAEETTPTTFELSDNIFANADVEPSDTVCLWLGANTMLEYPIEEARGLLEKNHKTAKENLKQTEDDLAFLHDQVTTMEVNIARVYNYQVKMRRKDKK
eukprot:CAMPEP_0201535008 /NCGR_PEP_ID=MMETSP0161_2-20130828/57759_1 /ASSEMBLY_ACC=CAM_ASM_000251 /TAXON_ID=180227 /ORGANISM="Neoparamoeba aestuarina, Strain SoJaBio B1-5/56/2" /LENGTH=188 /DNA_ID=CAMNT_0047939937 /DNA_START=26 /DNA_END=592 /DNA_ORIENTATION=+